MAPEAVLRRHTVKHRHSVENLTSTWHYNTETVTPTHADTRANQPAAKLDLEIRRRCSNRKVPAFCERGSLLQTEPWPYRQPTAACIMSGRLFSWPGAAAGRVQFAFAQALMSGRIQQDSSHDLRRYGSRCKDKR